MTVVQDEDLLKPINDPFAFDQVVHGTMLDPMILIMNSGLSKMARNHIHMAIGLPGKNGVISGMRTSCQVVIEVNMVRAMHCSDIKFHISNNGVILSGGDSNGLIPSKYFKTVKDMKQN
jgi:2'-phosphotransferase